MIPLKVHVKCRPGGEYFLTVFEVKMRFRAEIRWSLFPMDIPEVDISDGSGLEKLIAN